MLIFLRSIPWMIGVACAGGFFLVTRDVSLFVPVVLTLFVLLGFFYARLIDLPRNDFGFWNFFLVPMVLLLASVFFFIFLEEPRSMLLLGGVLTVLELIYAEHLFAYFHQPSRYRVYTIERISLVLSVVTSFLMASSLFGLLILLQLPLWMIAPVFFLFSTFMVYGVLWVSKVDSARSATSSLLGGIVLTEVFIALSFLPVAHTTGAGLLTVFLYFFLGMSRADFMDRLTRQVFLRYLFFTFVVLAVILLTAKWV